MAGWITNLQEETLTNENFREVLYTAPNSQVVIMSLLPNEEIGMETHEVDQVLYIVEGKGEAVLDGETSILEVGTVVVVPAGTEHNITNTSAADKMKLFTVYAPTEHPDGEVDATKDEAEAKEEEDE